MDIIEKGLHVGLSSINKYFFFYVMFYLIKALLCVMRIILLLEYDYFIRIHIMFLGFPIFPNYITSCDYECCILWAIEWKLDYLHLLYTFFISLYWEKQQWIESAWRVVDNLQDMLLCFSWKVVICICQISLVSLSANWLSVVGPFHKRVIDSFVIPIATIIKCTWHEFHLSNHFSKFSLRNSPFSFIRYCQPIVISSTNLFCVLPYFSSFAQIS
jgi:hypothetical protein